MRPTRPGIYSHPTTGAPCFIEADGVWRFLGRDDFGRYQWVRQTPEGVAEHHTVPVRAFWPAAQLLGLP